MNEPPNKIGQNPGLQTTALSMMVHSRGFLNLGYLLYILLDLTLVRKSSRCRTWVAVQNVEPVKRPSITRKKSSATEGVSTRPVSTAVSWLNTNEGPSASRGHFKAHIWPPMLTYPWFSAWSRDQQHQHHLGIGGSHLRKGQCSPEHPLSNHLPSSEAISLQLKVRASWPQ